MNVLSDGGFKAKYGALFSSPELLRILREYYAGLTEKVEVRLAGHSPLAHAAVSIDRSTGVRARKP